MQPNFVPTILGKIKPFTMYGIASFFLGFLFRGFIGPDAIDLVKMPFGLDLPVGASHGAGTVVLIESVKMLQVNCNKTLNMLDLWFRAGI